MYYIILLFYYLTTCIENLGLYGSTLQDSLDLKKPDYVSFYL